MVGGVVWLVLSEIQALELCNTLTTTFHNELRTNLIVQFNGTIDIRLSPKLGEHQKIVGGVI